MYGERARLATGLSTIQTIPGKHFPQEDQAPLLADHIAAFATRAGRSRVDAEPVPR